ncbi:MAG: outer membrane protein assembly factor BamD, partial [Planctomycetota bacterium]
AIESLSSSLLQEPRGKHAPQVCQRLAEALFRAGRDDESQRTLEKMLRAFPDHELTESTLFQLAELKVGSNETNHARRRYQELLEKYPNSKWATDARMRLAELAADDGDYSRVERVVTELIDVNAPTEKTLAKALILRANARRHQNKHNECLEDCDRFLNLDNQMPQRWDVMLMQAQSQREMTLLDAAKATLVRINQQNPSYEHRDQVIYQMAWVDLLQGRKKEAVGHFETLAGTFPHSRHTAEARFHTGQYKYKNREFELAAEDFRTAAQLGEGTIREKSLYKKGWCHVHLKDYESSLQTFKTLTADFPEGKLTRDGRFMTAESHFRLGHDLRALHIYLELSDDRDLNPQARELVHLHGSQIANRLKKSRVALAWLEPMGELFPESQYLTRAKLEIARAYRNEEKLLDAEYEYAELARELNDLIGATARYELAGVFRQQNQLGRAVREFQTLMYGYGGKSAPDEIRDLQAQAALVAAECESEMADQPGRGSRSRHIAKAQKMYRYVVTSHSRSKWAPEAQRQLNRMAAAADEANQTLR